MKHSPEKLSVETRYLKILLLVNCLSDRELARRAGISLGTVRNILAESGPYTTAKTAVEHVLDTPIWTNPKNFRSRRMQARPSRS